MLEVIAPKSEADWLELRSRDVTSTEVPALYRCSPYATHFELVHRKRAQTIVASEPGERARWGTRLQDAIALGIAEDEGWTVRRMTEYMRHPGVRLGASFDYAIGDDGLLEIKNVDALAFREGWLVDGDSIEAPPHIELQAQTQLAVSARRFLYIGALVGGNRVVLLRREPDMAIISSIRRHVASFWDLVNSGRDPEPDFVEDAGFIAKLYSQASPGKVLDVREDRDLAALVAEHTRLGEEERRAKQARDAVKAQLLMKIGDAEKVVGEGYSISSGTIAGTRVEAFDRSPYRNFRVTWKKVKGA